MIAIICLNFIALYQTILRFKRKWYAFVNFDVMVEYKKHTQISKNISMALSNSHIKYLLALYGMKKALPSDKHFAFEAALP